MFRAINYGFFPWNFWLFSFTFYYYYFFFDFKAAQIKVYYEKIGYLANGKLDNWNENRFSFFLSNYFHSYFVHRQREILWKKKENAFEIIKMNSIFWFLLQITWESERKFVDENSLSLSSVAHFVGLEKCIYFFQIKIEKIEQRVFPCFSLWC